MAEVVYYAIPSNSPLHQETATFLATAGIPANKWFTPLGDIETRSEISFTPSLRAEFEADGAEVPPGCEKWEILGQFLYSTLAIDPSSGKIYEFPEGEDFHIEVHADISSLAHALTVLRLREREFKGTTDSHSYENHAALAERMKEDIARVDGTPFIDQNSCWSLLLGEIATGMWG